MQISIRKSFSGKQILLTGASGFLGKVWLSYLLAKLPEIGKIYVLLRRKGSRSAAERFEQLFNTSPAFRPLREQYGSDLEAYAKSKIEILEGDVSEEDLGLDALTRKRLQRDLDLVVNCAGLVEFDPELRDSISINVLGTLHAAEFASKCVRPAFIHVSTSFVAGSRQGRIPEEIHPMLAPNGKAFDPEAELSQIETALERVAQMETDPDVLKAVREEIDGRIRKHKVESHNEKRVANLMKLGVRRVMREASVEEGQTRAKAWGWPNIYTYTKSLAESLLVTRYPNLPVTIFRPSIVESSVEYPFPGWNEGFNTCGPLAYLEGTWFRFLPAKKGNPFDIVPVDLVARGLTISSAALLAGKGSRVVHCGTSDRNLFTIDRASELTTLSHRVHYRNHGKNTLERVVLSRWDNVVVSPDYFLSAEKLAKLSQKGVKFLRTFSKNGFKPIEFLEKTERKLTHIDKIVKLFQPFIHDYHYIFVGESLKNLTFKEAEFEFTPEKMDWRRYWLDIQMPGLRKWCFPTIEGQKVETDHATNPVRFVKTETPNKKREISAPTIETRGMA